MVSWLVHNVDYPLFVAINGTAWPAWLDAVFLTLTHKYFYVGVAFLAVVFLPLRFRKAGLYAALTAAVAAGLADVTVARLLKPLFARARPPFVLDGVRLLIPDQSDAPSFPSSHAANGFAFGTAVLIFYRRTGLTLLAVATAVAFSRVYVGVHFPFDAVGGAAWGSFVGVCAASAHFYIGTIYDRWRYLRELKRVKPELRGT